MGGLLYRLFRLLPSRGAPSGVSGQDQPSSFPHVGRCGSRQSGEAVNGQIPPEAIQFGTGADIIVGSTGLPLCPVTAILKYIAVRGPAAGVFFRRAATQPALKAWFIEQLREILTAVGLPRQQYAGHSFRIGAATTAAIAGVEDSTIQTLGCWHSAAYLQYIRLPSELLAGVSAVLAKNTGTA